MFQCHSVSLVYMKGQKAGKLRYISDMQIELTLLKRGLTVRWVYRHWGAVWPDFFFGSFMLFLSCFCYAFMHVCLLMPCGHLLGKGWPLGSHLWWLITMSNSLSHWYPWSWVRCGAWLYWFLIFALFLTCFLEKKFTWVYASDVKSQHHFQDKKLVTG